MTTVSELVDKGDIPEERKDNVKKVLHVLGYAASRAVGKAFLKITKKHMTDAGMSIAGANAILAEVEPLQGGGEAALLGMEEFRMLAAFAKQHMKKAHSVRLPDLDPSQWGLRIKPYTGEISGLELQPVTPFQWNEAPEASQASHYLPQTAVISNKYFMTRSIAELGFTIRGTTDAALVLQQSIAAAANGLRWRWELKRQLHAPTEEMPARTPSASPSSRSSDAIQV
ncbi:TPA: hypothetical protein ACH3X1_004329 [Trebouxia sp. C0004]